MASVRTIHIGLLGLGTVGAGVLRILRDHQASLERRLGARMVVKRALVRDLSRARRVDDVASLLTDDPAQVLEDPEIDVVVELVGGTGAAREFVSRALGAGKHVVTANKALLATHGGDLAAAARSAGRALGFEGAVAGGIPIVRAIQDGLASDEVVSLCGIVNGTCNYVLDQMTRCEMGYAEAVALAQREGYAEADPTLDVGGFDAAHKLAVLTAVGFGVRVGGDTVHVEGIEAVRAFDIEVARDLGCVIRSVAVASRGDAGLHLRVHPVLLATDHVLAGVQGAFNAVLVESKGLGPSMYYGQGAGMMPTAVAVVSDLVEVARGALRGQDPHVHGAPLLGGDLETQESLPMDALSHRNYLCVHTPHRAGVLGRVASTLGRHGVSIARVRQDAPDEAGHARMIIITERVREDAMRAALAELDGGGDCEQPTVRIRFLESPGS